MRKLLISLSIFIMMASITGCFLFGPDQEAISIGAPVELTVTGTDDVTILKANVTIGAMYKFIVEEKPSSYSLAQASIAVDLYPDADDFYDRQHQQAPVLNEDDGRIRTVYFHPQTTPFYLKINPFLDFKGSVTATLYDDSEAPVLLADGSLNVYDMTKAYEVFTLSTTAGSTYSFKESSPRLSFVEISLFNKIDATKPKFTEDEFTYTAVGAKTYVLVEVHPGSVPNDFKLTITKQ